MAAPAVDGLGSYVYGTVLEPLAGRGWRDDERARNRRAAAVETP